MNELYYGEIILFAGNFAPQNTMFCNGQLLAIAQNNALFSVIGNTYGGDGRTSFALPDLRGRAPIQQGTGIGLSPRRLGERAGSEINKISTQQLPTHNHSAAGTIKASNVEATTSDPTSIYPAKSNYVIDRSNTASINSYGMTTDTNMANDGVTVTVGNTGNGLPVNNMQPWLALNYIICINGIYPTRS